MISLFLPFCDRIATKKFSLSKMRSKNIPISLSGRSREIESLIKLFANLRFIVDIRNFFDDKLEIIIPRKRFVDEMRD